MHDARSNLVERLDRYASEQPELFSKVSLKIKEIFIPQIRQGTISGTAICKIYYFSILKKFLIFFFMFFFFFFKKK